MHFFYAVRYIVLYCLSHQSINTQRVLGHSSISGVLYLSYLRIRENGRSEKAEKRGTHEP